MECRSSVDSLSATVTLPLSRSAMPPKIGNSIGGGIMGLKTIALMGAAAFSLITSAHADTHQMGTNLLNDCKAANQTCYAYLLGVYDGSGITGSVAHHPLICPNGGVNGDQLRDVYVKWAVANPSLAASDERGTAGMVAMAKAFPCGK